MPPPSPRQPADDPTSIHHAVLSGTDDDHDRTPTHVGDTSDDPERDPRRRGDGPPAPAQELQRLELARLESSVAALERAHAVHDRGILRMRRQLTESTSALRSLAVTVATLDGYLRQRTPDAAIVLHYPNGSHRHLDVGAVGNTEQLGQHLCELVIRAHPSTLGATVHPAATIQQVAFSLRVFNHLAQLLPHGIEHHDVRRSWDYRELRSGRAATAVVGEAALDLARSLPALRDQLDSQLRFHQQRVADLAGRTTAMFAGFDELTALRQRLDALQTARLGGDRVTARPAPRAIRQSTGIDI